MATKEEVEGLDVTKLQNPCEAMKEAREERRWSERVQELAAKKNQKDIPAETTGPEGNNMPSSSFSALSNDELVDRSLNMGVIIDKSNVIIIGMLAELEQDRQALCDKAKNYDADMIKNNNT
jgi:hypothetical protein